MRLIKLAVLSFIILFLLVTAMSLLIPANVRISKAINLPPPKEAIVNLVSDTNQWHSWHPVFLYYNSVKQAKFASLQQKAINDSQIVFNWLETGKRPLTNGFQFYEYASTDSVTLQWFMDFKLHWYPWEKFGSLFYENTYGRMMENGLQNIKNKLEGNPVDK